ncbi:MAG: hypothetical protein IJZ65_07440 [Ruminiclostridium sp.]|nr:hypothetical protein [Ruminiclostridium sp.]
MLKKERYNLTLNPKVVSIIDKLANYDYVSRSEYINSILVAHIITERYNFDKNSDKGFCNIFGVSNEQLDDMLSEVS